MDTQPTENNKSTMPNLRWVSWLILIALVIWNVMTLIPSTPADATIPYSTFLTQVRAQNVTSVVISGNQIKGKFTKPIEWTPPAASAAITSATPAVAPTAATPSTLYGTFATTFPDTVGDPNLMALLETNNVTINATQPATPWLGLLLTNGLPLLLLIGVMVWIGRKATSGQSGVLNFSRSRARRYVPDQPAVTFDDVAGADESKLELQEVVDFLKNPIKYHDIGARIPRGILLVGSPGTGKTLLARAVAGQAGVPFFSISASEFVEMFVGVGASRVRDLFTQAKTAAPAIVFIDELDAVGRRRGAGIGNTNDEREQTLNQLLVEMDGFDEHHEVIVLAATNRPDVLDPALLRPGRFDREVVVGIPDRKGREGILRIHTRKLRLEANVDLTLLARTTTGFSGADLANLCNEAALIAARHNHLKVSMADFEEALDKVLLGGVRPILLDPHERRVVAYHEAGHALVAWLTPAADSVHKVTIIPHGQALGVTEQLSPDDRYNYSQSYLLARLAVFLGGRTAEEIALGDVTTGAENDLVEATRLARRMVTRWGMGSLGLVAFRSDEQQPFLGYELAQGRDYSEDTAARVDKNIERLLENRHEVVYRLLSDARTQLDTLVDALLREETLDQAAMARILGPRPEHVSDLESATNK